MSRFRRKLMVQHNSTGIVLPDYDKTAYPYYGLLRGYTNDEVSVQKYVFLVSADKKSYWASPSTWRFTTNFSAYIMYNSDDGKTWELVANGVSSTIDTHLLSSTVEILDENILMEG